MLGRKMTIAPKKKPPDSPPSCRDEPLVPAPRRSEGSSAPQAGLLAGLSDLFTRRRHGRVSLRLSSAVVSHKRDD